MKKLLHISLALSLLLIGACRENEGSTSRVDFDERAMLSNYGSNLILPGYAQLRQRTETLQSSVLAFTQAPSEATLTAAQQAHLAAWLAWQNVNFYEFGPALELNLRRNINTFPTQFPKINNAIQSGNWDINGLFSHDMRGFPALDFLLHSETENGAAILERYTTSDQAANWKRFANEVATHLHGQTQENFRRWSPEGGNYLGTFNTNTGTSASSSTSLLVNQIIQGFEVIKNQRMREPLGLLSINNQPAPRNVEAFYSENSLQLMQANLQALDNIFEGRYATADGPGLADFLRAHHAAGNTQADLAAETLDQIQKIRTGVNGIQGPLRVAVVEQRDQLSLIYRDMVDLMPLIKADIPSALSIRVEDYGDTDGD